MAERIGEIADVVIDDDVHRLAGLAVAGRKLASRWGVDLHAVAVGMVGGGDVLVTAGLAAGW